MIRFCSLLKRDWCFTFPILVIASSALTLGAWVVANARSPVEFPIDLIPTFVAGKVWLAGHPEAVYQGGPWIDINTAHPYWLQTVQQQRTQLSDTAFVYSPTYLALLLPLIAATKPLQFYWIIAIVNSVCAFLLGWESTRLAGVRSIPARTGIALLVAHSFPSSYAAMFGQNSIIAACCILYSFRFLTASRLGWGIALLLIACLCKPWCVLFLGVLVVQRMWKALCVSTVAYFAVSAAIPLLFFPAALTEGYHRVSTALPKLSVLAFNNVSLRALIARLQMDDWTPHAWSWQKHGIVDWPAIAAEAVVVVPLALWLCVRLFQRPVRPETVYPAAMALVLLPLGVCWSHYLVFALPLVVVSTLSGVIPKPVRLLGWVCATWLMLLLSAAAPSLHTMRPPEVWALIYSAPLLLTALLALLTLLGRTDDPIIAHRCEPICRPAELS